MLMPFGKYRGTSVTELPFDYLQWLTSIDLLDPLRTEVKKEYESVRETFMRSAPIRGVD